MLCPATGAGGERGGKCVSVVGARLCGQSADKLGLRLMAVGLGGQTGRWRCAELRCQGGLGHCMISLHM